MSDKNSAPDELLSELAKIIQEGKKFKTEKFKEKYNVEIGADDFLGELVKLQKDFADLEAKLPDLVIEEPIVEPIPVLDNEETWAQRAIDEDDLVKKSAEHIKKRVNEVTNLFSVPPVETYPTTLKLIQKRIELLEQWLYKVSAEGAGSGSYWLNDLGDTYKQGIQNSSNNHILVLDGNINKWTGKTSNTVTNLYQFCGAFSDTTDQYSNTAGVPIAVSFNTTDYSYGINVANNSQVVCQNAGVYNFQFSVQISTTTSSTNYVYIWPRVNGIDIPNSNSRETIKGDDIVIGWNWVLPMNKNDYFQLMFYASDSRTHINKISQFDSFPAVPSIILTVTPVRIY